MSFLYTKKLNCTHIAVYNEIRSNRKILNKIQKINIYIELLGFIQIQVNKRTEIERRSVSTVSCNTVFFFTPIE